MQLSSHLFRKKENGNPFLGYLCDDIVPLDILMNKVNIQEGIEQVNICYNLN